MCINKYERRHETPGFGLYEPLCTASNIWFIVLGSSRLIELEEFHLGYFLMVLAGVCSAFHHATPEKWTIVIDWIPISISILWILSNGILHFATMTTWIKIVSALLFLFEDHVLKLIPVPYGHSFWHILAAWSIDGLYYDEIMNCNKN